MKQRLTVYIDNAKKINNKIYNTLSFTLDKPKKVTEQGKIVHLTYMLQAIRIMSSLKQKGIKLRSKNRKGEPIVGYQFTNILK